MRNSTKHFFTQQQDIRLLQLAQMNLSWNKVVLTIKKEFEIQVTSRYCLQRLHELNPELRKKKSFKVNQRLILQKILEHGNNYEKIVEEIPQTNVNYICVLISFVLRKTIRIVEGTMLKMGVKFQPLSKQQVVYMSSFLYCRDFRIHIVDEKAVHAITSKLRNKLITIYLKLKDYRKPAVRQQINYRKFLENSIKEAFELYQHLKKQRQLWFDHKSNRRKQRSYAYGEFQDRQIAKLYAQYGKKFGKIGEILANKYGRSYKFRSNPIFRRCQYLVSLGIKQLQQEMQKRNISMQQQQFPGYRVNREQIQAFIADKNDFRFKIAVTFIKLSFGQLKIQDYTNKQLIELNKIYIKFMNIEKEDWQDIKKQDDLVKIRYQEYIYYYFTNFFDNPRKFCQQTNTFICKFLKYMEIFIKSIFYILTRYIHFDVFVISSNIYFYKKIIQKNNRCKNLMSLTFFKNFPKFVNINQKNILQNELYYNIYQVHSIQTYQIITNLSTNQQLLQLGDQIFSMRLFYLQKKHYDFKVYI